MSTTICSSYKLGQVSVVHLLHEQKTICYWKNTWLEEDSVPLFIHKRHTVAPDYWEEEEEPYNYSER
mgnify:CR=1 FL=1